MKARAVAPWLQAALGGAALIAAADCIIHLQRAVVIGRLLENPTLAANQAVVYADRRVQAIGLAALAWLVVTAALFMVWTGFAYRDLVHSGARHRMPTAAAVLAPFIPIASLALVPGAMDDLTRQGRFARTPRVAWWFAVYLLAGVARYAGAVTIGDGTLADYQRSDRIYALADLPQIAAAAVLVGLIAMVTTRAAERGREAEAVASADLASDPVATGGALGWYRDPNRQAEVRWWDGIDWTVHVASSRHAPPPVVRGTPVTGTNAAPMPRTARVCLFAGFLSILVITAPFVLGLGVWALRDLGQRPGAPGRGRAWFAVISGGLFTLLLVLSIAFG